MNKLGLLALLAMFFGLSTEAHARSTDDLFTAREMRAEQTAADKAATTKDRSVASDKSATTTGNTDSQSQTKTQTDTEKSH